MKKSHVFYFKTMTVILGFLLVAIGFFTEFQSTCDFSEDTDIILSISISGAKTPVWYFFSLGSILIFSIGYFSTNQANKILVFCFAGILIVLISFITLISQAGWGRPCGRSSEYGFYLTLLGSLLVLTATIISMYRVNSSPSKLSDDLLDQN